MIILYDIAKKENALVCGTENRSESLLGYCTRFGDEASDIEPIRHLYKTQVYELAKYLNIPQSVIQKMPSANLWEGQTDESQFDFTYVEADQVLSLYFDKKLSVEEIQKQGFKNAGKIIEFTRKNFFKHKVPYAL
jgi:NAD+ synthase